MGSEIFVLSVCLYLVEQGMYGLLHWIRKDSDKELTFFKKAFMNHTIQSCDSVLSAVELIPKNNVKESKMAKLMRKRSEGYTHRRRESSRGRITVKPRVPKCKRTSHKLPPSFANEAELTPRKKSLRRFLLGDGYTEKKAAAEEAKEVEDILQMYRANNTDALNEKLVKSSCGTRVDKSCLETKQNVTHLEHNGFDEYDISCYEEETSLKNLESWATLSYVPKPLPKMVHRLKKTEFESPFHNITPAYKPKSWASVSSICSPTYSQGPRFKTVAELKSFKDIAFTFNDTPESSYSQYFSSQEQACADENIAPAKLCKSTGYLPKKREKNLVFSPVKKLVSVIKETSCLSPIVFREKSENIISY